MRNEQVAKAWANGKAASGSNFHTDGVSLYSYAQCIGDTMLSGRKVVYDYSISRTTSRHIGLAKRFV